MDNNITDIQKKNIIIKGKIDKGYDFNTENGLFVELLILSDNNIELLSPNSPIITYSSYKNNKNIYIWNKYFMTNILINSKLSSLIGLIKIWEITPTNSNNLISFAQFNIPLSTNIHKHNLKTLSIKGDLNMDKLKYYLNITPTITNFDVYINNDTIKKYITTYSNGTIDIELDVINLTNI